MNNDVELIPVKGVLPSVQVQSDNVIYVPQAHKNKAGIVKEGDGVLIENGVVSLNRQTVEDMIDANKWVSYGFKQNLTEDEKGMARHNIGAGDNDFTGSYYDVTQKPHLNTNNTAGLDYGDEELNDTINLHKISKTGSFNDLKNVPQETLDFAESERQKSKNLFNAEAIHITNSRVTYDKDTNTFTYTMNSTIEGTNTSFVILKCGKLKPGTYTMSFNTTSTIGNTAPVIVVKLDEYNNFSTSIATKHIIDGYIYLTFTLTEETNIGLAWYYKAGWIAGDAPPGVKTLTNLQLEEGSVATDYQPYNGAMVHEKDILGASTLTLIYSKYSTDANLNKGKTTGIYETSGAVSIDFNEYDFALCKIRSDQANHDYTASLFMLIPLKYGVGVGGNYTGCISVENPYNVIRRNTAKINMVSIFATIPTTKDSISIFTTSHNEEQTPTSYESLAIEDIWGVKLL